MEKRVQGGRLIRKRLTYNKIYNKTSIGIGDIFLKNQKLQNKNFQSFTYYRNA